MRHGSNTRTHLRDWELPLVPFALQSSKAFVQPTQSVLPTSFPALHEGVMAEEKEICVSAAETEAVRRSKKKLLLYKRMLDLCP